MIRKYATLTRTATSELLYMCNHCELRANALVTARASATTSSGALSAPDDPGVMVAEALRDKKRKMIRLAPCPRCSKRDDVAVRVFRNKQIFIGMLLAVSTAVFALVFAGPERLLAVSGMAMASAYYAYTQWDLWARSPARVRFHAIEPRAELPVARAIERPVRRDEPRPIEDAEPIALETPEAVEPTPFSDGPSLLK